MKGVSYSWKEWAIHERSELLMKGVSYERSELLMKGVSYSWKSELLMKGVSYSWKEWANNKK